MTYVFDSSSIIASLITHRGRAVDLLAGQWTPGLAYYEIGNAMLKELERGGWRLHEAGTKLQRLGVIPEQMNIHDVWLGDELKAVLGTAEKLGLTFYGAAYAYLARKLGAQLVTEDRFLGEKAGGVSAETVAKA